MISRWLLAVSVLASACAEGTDCPRCDTLVIAATGEPDVLLPPLVDETVGRDVSDLIYERLAVLPGGSAPGDSAAYRPGLAVHWDRVDSATLRFHLRPNARWHDGAPVTAMDVAFSFGAYADSTLDAEAQATIAGRIAAFAVDDSTVLVRFSQPHPEQWYDATWHVRILPRHVWDSIPTASWGESADSAHLVGSGPYRLTRRVASQSLTLERVETGPAPPIHRVVWLFTQDQDAALNLLRSHEADLLESIGEASRVAMVRADTLFATIAYPSAVYGFLGFNFRSGRRGPTTDVRVRRALAMAVDRSDAAHAAVGPGAVAPPGPMSRILWIYDSAIAPPPYDTAEAKAVLDEAGWPRGKDGLRRRDGKVLSLDVLVPATSMTRRTLAQVLQERWRGVGIRATITIVDFAVFQERLRTGRFETFIGSWLDEPSPRGLEDQWTTEGIGRLNYTAYQSRAFDSLFHRAATFQGPQRLARQAWHEAMAQLNGDLPGIWLYNPTNTAAVSKRLGGVTIDPYSWLSRLPEWTLAPIRPTSSGR